VIHQKEDHRANQNLLDAMRWRFFHKKFQKNLPEPPVCINHKLCANFQNSLEFGAMDPVLIL